jgi:hypothetical protein
MHLQEYSQANHSSAQEFYDDHDASDEAMDNLYNDQSVCSVERDDHTPFKRKGAEPKDVTEVHRSTRIATKKAGYKTKEAKEKGEASNSVDINTSMQHDPKNKKQKGKTRSWHPPHPRLIKLLSLTNLLLHHQSSRSRPFKPLLSTNARYLLVR